MIAYATIPDYVLDYSKEFVRDGRTAAAVMAVFATFVVIKILFIMVIGVCIIYIGRNAMRQSKTIN